MSTEGPPFIDALFTTLRTKSYLPYNSPPPPAPLLPPDSGIPIPLDAIIPSGSSSSPDRGRKRPSDYDDNIPPPKGPRVNQDGSFSRHGPHRGPGWSNGNWGGGSTSRGGYGGSMDDVNGATPPRMNGRGPSAQYHPPDQQRRGICRDYYSERILFHSRCHTNICRQRILCSRCVLQVQPRRRRTRSGRFSHGPSTNSRKYVHAHVSTGNAIRHGASYCV